MSRSYQLVIALIWLSVLVQFPYKRSNKPFKSHAQISLPVVDRHLCHVHVGVAFPLSSLRVICRCDYESCNLNPNPNPNPNIISHTSAFTCKLNLLHVLPELL